MKYPLYCCALAISSQTVADSSTPPALEETLIIASRIEQPLRTIGSSVSALDRAELDALAYNSAAEAIRSLPSVSVSNTGGAGQPTTLRIRGESGYSTLLMIDGIEISDPSAPQKLPIFDHLQLDSIERIELLRGPQGLIYGADAGGVINMISRRAGDEPQATLSLSGGDYGELRASAFLAAGNERVNFSVNLESSKNQGFSAADRATDPAQENDAYDNTTLHGRIEFALTEHLSTHLVARNTQAQAEFDNCFYSDPVTFQFLQSNNCLSDFEQTAFRAALLWQSDALNQEIAFEHTDNKRDSLAEKLLSFGTDGEVQRVEYLATVKLAAAHKLLAGAELETTGYEDNFGTDTERDQESLFFEYLGTIAGRLHLTAGLRYDDNEDFGSHLSYRFTTAYPLKLDSGELKLRASYGNGFRAPSLFEIYNNLNFAGLTDANLAEEQSKGMDLGLDYFGKSGLQLQLTVFNTRVDDEIVYDPQQFAYAQIQGHSESTGVEASALLPLGEQLTLDMNYTYTDSETAGGQARPRTPEQQANIALRVKLLDDKLQLAAHYRLSRDSFDLGSDPVTFAPINVALEDYGVLGLSARYRLNDTIEFFAHADNALDENYQEVIGFNTSGSAVYAGLKLRIR